MGYENNKHIPKRTLGEKPPLDKTVYIPIEKIRKLPRIIVYFWNGSRLVEYTPKKLDLPNKLEVKRYKFLKKNREARKCVLELINRYYLEIRVLRLLGNDTCKVVEILKKIISFQNQLSQLENSIIDPSLKLNDVESFFEENFLNNGDKELVNLILKKMIKD